MVCYAYGMTSKKESPAEPEPTEVTVRTPRSKLWSRVALVFGIVVSVTALIYGWLFATTPAAVRLPQLEHAHLRFEVIVGGTAANFADAAFQTQYAQACSDTISPEPIHFHDGKDQFLHVHWKGVTGGIVLKNYGLNYIGGADDTLGYRFDTSLLPTRVPIHGKNLPAAPAGAQLWVYTGDAGSYKERASADFLQQDFETFLGKKSSVGQLSWPETLLFARASAHNGVDHGSTQEATEHESGEPATTAAPAKTQEELVRIQNLLGNIVVFVQKDKPSDAQVAERFNNLAPLPQSTCGG